MSPLSRDILGIVDGNGPCPRANNEKQGGHATGILRGTRSSVLRVLLFSALGIASAVGMMNQATSAAPPTIYQGPRVDTVNEVMSMRASSLQSLVVVPDAKGIVTTSIEVEGKTWTLILHKHSLRADRFQVLVQAGANGALVPVEPPPVSTYRGSVLEVPDALVSALVVDGQLTATIGTRFGIYGIQPVSKLGVAAAAGEHVVYRAGDWVNRDGSRCGTPDSWGVAAAVDEGGSGRVAGTGLQVANLAIDADVEFFQLNGSSVDNTVLDIETVLDTVELIYERDSEIAYEVTTIVVRTAEPDPYSTTDAFGILCEFLAEWNSAPQSSISRDTSHLFTGKNIDGGTIGIAYLGVVCNVSGNGGCSGVENLAYGVSQSRFTSTFTSRVALTAHEIGHNWGAFHCDGDGDCHIMCSGLGGCAGLSGSNLKFGSSSKNSIASFRDTRTCLSDLADVQILPFIEEFPSSTLDTDRWSYNNGGFITDFAVDEPSPPWSLNIDAASSQEFRDDEIRSNFIALGGTLNVVLSYFTQHRGVEAGEELFVEYWNNNLTWKELNRLESDGIDQETFEAHLHTLPDDAKHDEFRIRFRTNVSGFSDDWFIDDVVIRAICESEVDCDNGSFCDGQEICVEETCNAGSAACAPDEGCDETLNQCYSLACGLTSVTGQASRYLSITPAEGSEPLALLVAPMCDPSAAKYVGPPGDPGNTALLVDDVAAAAFLTPAGWNGTVHVAGIEIVPETGYYVWADCGTPGESALSQVSSATTGVWGDVVGSFVDGAWTLPEGIVNITDILAILEGFVSAPTAPPIHRIDLIGINAQGIACTGDQGIDIIDAVAAISGFQGLDYVLSFECPAPCSPGIK